MLASCKGKNLNLILTRDIIQDFQVWVFGQKSSIIVHPLTPKSLLVHFGGVVWDVLS
jgi:hypothetical protein